MTQQPEALRLARELDDIHTTHVARNAAAELRRLHASCEDYAQHKQRQDQRVLELNAQCDALLEALRAFESCALPVSRNIDERGHSWTEAYLDQALPIARAAIKAVEETK